MFALFFVGKVTSASAQCSAAFFFSILGADPVHLRRCVCHYFNLRLSYVCVRCAAQVWSVLRFPAARRPPHTRSLFQVGGGRTGSEEKEQDEKREWKRENTVIRAYFILISPRKDILCFCSAPLAGIQAVLSFTLWSTFPLSFFPFSAPLSLSCLSVTDSGKRVLALTPRAPPFVMKEEITALICAYFASFWITHPQIILFTPHFLLNYSSTCEKNSGN